MVFGFSQSVALVGAHCMGASKKNSIASQRDGRVRGGMEVKLVAIYSQ